VIQEAAPFGISFTIVEPGGARADFGGRSMKKAAYLPAYDEVLAPFRARLERENSNQSAVGDPVKVAEAMIASANQSPAPRRLTLGSDAYTLVTAGLRDRLTALESARELAFSTDADDVQH
jgi:hypothetical protein